MRSVVVFSIIMLNTTFLANVNWITTSYTNSPPFACSRIRGV